MNHAEGRLGNLLFRAVLMGQPTQPHGRKGSDIVHFPLFLYSSTWCLTFLPWFSSPHVSPSSLPPLTFPGLPRIPPALRLQAGEQRCGGPPHRRSQGGARPLRRPLGRCDGLARLDGAVSAHIQARQPPSPPHSTCSPTPGQVRRMRWVGLPRDASCPLTSSPPPLPRPPPPPPTPRQRVAKTRKRASKRTPRTSKRTFCGRAVERKAVRRPRRRTVRYSAFWLFAGVRYSAFWLFAGVWREGLFGRF